MTLLGDIFTYAFRGSGKYVFLIGAILSVISDIASSAPVLGGIAGFLISGYFCAFYFEIIQSSATGGAEAPEFPSLSDMMEDVVWPILKTIFVGLVSFLPLLAYRWFGPDDGSPLVVLALASLGTVYFPMAMLAVVVVGRLVAASPHIVLPSIARAGWLYWLAVFLLVLLYMGESMLADAVKGVPLLGSLILAVVGMYVFFTNGRILGVIYRERSEELNWL